MSSQAKSRASVPATTEEAARFSVDIAPGMHPMHYAYDDLVRSVDALPRSAFTLRLTGADVVRYRVEQEPAGRVEIQLTADASARLRRHPDYGFALHGAYFDVRFDGARSYVAIGWERIGAAAIRTPVIHVEPLGDGLVLRVGAQQGAWYSWGNFGADPARVDRPDVRACFATLGSLDRVPALSAPPP